MNWISFINIQLMSSFKTVDVYCFALWRSLKEISFGGTGIIELSERCFYEFHIFGKDQSKRLKQEDGKEMFLEVQFINNCCQ
jgi:hypothetical protein